MTQTLNSGSASYLPVAQFLLRTDNRRVAQFLSDTNVAVQQSSVPTNPILLAILNDASGVLESAATMGNRYSPADLLLLSTSGLVGTGIMWKILTVMTWNALEGRRLDLNVGPHPDTQWANDMLEALSIGTRIFPFQETQNAGILAHQIETERDIVQRAGMVPQARRYFGKRAQDIGRYPTTGW